MSSQDQGTIRKRRLERELYWIARLRTAHPLGLNDKIQAYGISGNATDGNFRDYNFYRIANLVEGKKKTRRHRHLRKKRGQANDDEMKLFSERIHLGGHLILAPRFHITLP